MDDELKLRREMDRALKAKELFRNPIFEESFDALKAQYEAEWSSTAPKDSDTRERLYYLTQALDAIRSHLKSVLETGTMAEHQIKELHKKSLM